MDVDGKERDIQQEKVGPRTLRLEYKNAGMWKVNAINLY